MNRKKVFPGLLVLGAFILLFRTVRLLFFENGINLLMPWVIILTFIEMGIDLLCIFFSFRWFLKEEKEIVTISLRLGAVAAVFHALRVLIYALGRLGPLKGFDVRPEFRTSVSGDVFWVYFAAVLSVLGLAAVLVIWLIRKRVNKNS